jgi:hypothetical protein
MDAIVDPRAVYFWTSQQSLKVCGTVYTESSLVNRTVMHAREIHGFGEVIDELAQKVMTPIRDERSTHAAM